MIQDIQHIEIFISLTYMRQYIILLYYNLNLQLKMNCYLCKNIFDQSIYVPRLLILCGHSLCENCIVKTFANGKLICPQCHTINAVDTISNFPKNLALLSVKLRQSNEKEVEVCFKHNKKFEAFCDKEKHLLCINCILQDGHRNHPIQSLNNAFVKQKEKLTKIVGSTEKLYQNINEKLLKIEDNIKNAISIYDDTEIIIDKYFLELKKIITAEEDILKNKSRDLFTNFQRKNIEKQSQYSSHLELIDQFFGIANKADSLPAIDFLHSVKDRDDIIQKLNIELQQVNPFTSLLINKNYIFDSIIKQIQKSKLKDFKDNPTKDITNNNNKEIKKPQMIQKIKKFVPSKENSKNPQKKIGKNINNNKQQKKSLGVEKPLPKYDVSAFQENPYLFKSFLSSNTSFFIEKRNIYIFGGFCDQSNSVLRFNVDNSKWEEVTTMQNRSKFGIGIVNKQIILLGGKREKQRISSTQVFSQGKLSNGQNLNGVRSGFGTVVINQEIYVVGGNDGEEILKTFQIYNKNQSRWQRLENLNENRDQLAVTVGRDGKIYAIGGFGSTENVCLKSVQRYDLELKKWQYTNPMITQRRALSAVTLADGIYAIGGFDGQNYLSSVEKYDEYSNSWTVVAKMNEARCTHCAVSVFQTQQIYVFGGFDYSPLSSVERYNVMSDNWQTIGPMPSARFMHGSVYLKE